MRCCEEGKRNPRVLTITLHVTWADLFCNGVSAPWEKNHAPFWPMFNSLCQEQSGTWHMFNKYLVNEWLNDIKCRLRSCVIDCPEHLSPNLIEDDKMQEVSKFVDWKWYFYMILEATDTLEIRDSTISCLDTRFRKQWPKRSEAWAMCWLGIKWN